MTIEPRIAAAGPAYYDSPGDLPPGTKASLKMRLADDAWTHYTVSSSEPLT